MASYNEVEVSVELNFLTAAEHEKEMKPKQNVIECRAITHGTGSQEILPQCH